MAEGWESEATATVLLTYGVAASWKLPVAQKGSGGETLFDADSKLFGGWEVNRDAGAAAGLVVGPDTAIVANDDFLDDGEPQP